MSMDLYHFHMVIRQEEMSRSERLAADEQAARIVKAASELGRAVAGALRRPERRVGAIMRPGRAS